MFKFMNVKNDPQSALLMKKRLLHGIVSFVRYFFLLALSYVVLFQLIYMISYSVRPPADAYNPSVVWIPSTITFDHFVEAFGRLDYLNTGLVSIWLLEVSFLDSLLLVASIK